MYLLAVAIVALALTGLAFMFRDLALFILTSLAWFGFAMYSFTNLNNDLFGGLGLALAIAGAFWGIRAVASSRKPGFDEDAFIDDQLTKAERKLSKRRRY